MLAKIVTGIELVSSTVFGESFLTILFVIGNIAVFCAAIVAL